MGKEVDRAFQLLGASRPDLAEREFRAALAAEPSDANALAGLAIALNANDKDDEALATARAAVAAGPDRALARAALARALLNKETPKEALVEAEAAVRMEPMNAYFHGLVGLASLSIGRPADALDAATRGLSLDADDETCAHVRGMAMVRLNRRDDAESTLRTSLARNPESSNGHAILGHSLLMQNKVREAAEHFRESLRLDPTNEAGREGLLHTLRARVPIYRLFLWWISFCQRMPAGVVVGVLLISFMIGPALASIGKAYPSLALIILPLRLLVIGLAMLTWIAEPLFNAALLLTRDGRLLLRPAERMWALVMVLLCPLPVIFIALGVISAGQGETMKLFARAAGASLFLLIPIGVCASGWERKAERPMLLAMLAVLLGLAVYGVLADAMGIFTIAAIASMVFVNARGVAKGGRWQ
jgi:tetratricopeptide (TPR) repeat protein